MISINLLPIEFRQQEIKRAKFYKIQVAGVGVVLLMVFLSSLTIALRILQSQNLSQIQKIITQSEEKISDLKTTQGAIILLKDRLTTINQYLGSPSKQTQMYNLIAELLPSSVSLSGISVGKEGDVILSANTKDSSSLDELANNLISKEKNQDKIAQISFETLNRGRDGIYRFSLRVKTK